MAVETVKVLTEADQARIEQRKRDILDAAIKCVRRYGAKKVAVEDIALAAGVSRRTLYRFFPGRREIMEAVVYDRLESIAAGVKTALQLCDGFEESVVVGTLETLRLARADKIYGALVAEDRRFLLDHDPRDRHGPIRSLSASIWSDVFASARADGVLRSTLTDEEALDWLIEVHRLLDVRTDLSDEEIADILRKYVLHSLVPDARLAEAGRHPSASRKRAPKV